jgi:hypothetical protein
LLANPRWRRSTSFRLAPCGASPSGSTARRASG